MTSESGAIPRPAAAGLDRGGLALLAAGHFAIDASVGAVPAMIPVFTAAFALSDLAASMILGASLLVSSAIQPVFGLLADRRATPVFLWGGVALALAGFALSGLASGYLGLLAFIVGSGLGVAAFHPEAARVANQLSADRAATGLAWFMVGGNAGFAAGPLLAALFIPLLDARATLVFLVPGALVALWLHRSRQRLAVPVVSVGSGVEVAGRTQLPALILLIVVTTLRTWTQFCLLALAPLLLTDERGFSDQAAGLAIFVFSAGGAVGTLLGAALAERAGGRRMLMASMPLVAPAIAGFLLLDGPLSIALLGVAGTLLLASFSVTVAMGQQYMPSRLALAAGLMIGFAAIGSAPPGLALFGWIADQAGREAAIWGIAALPLAAGLLASLLPGRPASAPARSL